MPAHHHEATGTAGSAEDSSDGVAPPRCYVLRRAAAGDHDQLADLERAVFPAVWPPTNFAREIKKTTQAILVAVLRSDVEKQVITRRRASFVERVVGGIRTLAASGGPGDHERERAAGWVVVWFVAGEAHIASIGVASSDRRRGVGELLTLGAIEIAAANDCDELTLEVRKSNEAAQALYRKYGFQVVGERKGYYVDDNEDALIMTTPDIREPAYAARLAGLAADHARRWEESGSRFERA